jgi:hypothetical protein
METASSTEYAETHAPRHNLAPWIAAAVALGLMIGALVIVYSTLSSKINSQGKKLQNTRAGLRYTQAKLSTAAQPDIAALKRDVAVTRTALAKANATIKLYNQCLPELMSYINGQTIQQSSTGGYLTGAYLSNGQQVSKTCQTVLYGPATGG